MPTRVEIRRAERQHRRRKTQAKIAGVAVVGVIGFAAGALVKAKTAGRPGPKA